MKTLEQKAKAYDEALEKAKSEYQTHKSFNGFCEMLVRIFPELKESEDEGIRKELLEHCKNQAKPYIQTGNKCPQIQSWIAWLEKHNKIIDECIYGDDKVEPKFKVGDTIVEKDFDECGYGTIKDIKDGKYIFTDGSWMNIDEQGEWQLVKTSANVEQKPATWSREDEQNLNAALGYIRDEYLSRWLKDAIYNKYEKPAWSEEDDQYVEDIIALIYRGLSYNPIGQIQDWLKSLKDRVQPKQERNEEDEPQSELAETYLAKFDEKFPILPILKDKQLADYKDFLNACQQIFGLKYWGIRPLQAKLFEKLSLLWAAWGAEHLKGLGQTNDDTDNEKQGWSEDDNLYYGDICEILMNLLHSEREGINKAAVQKDLDWLWHIKKRTRRNEKDTTGDEIINYFKCQTRDEPSRKDIHDKWISWIKNKK